MKQVNLPERDADCCTPAARSGKSSLWFSVVLKLLLLVVFVQGAGSRVSAQTTGDAGIYANFGIDGDLYTNMFQFPAIPCVFPSAGAISASDDWFPHGGTGFAVIDTSGAAAFRAQLGCPNPVNGTHLFQKNFFSFQPVPTGPTSFNIMIDAVAVRDWYGLSGSLDSSTFVGQSNKNGDDPTTWSIGAGTSGPNKNDLIDVGAHLRREVPNALIFDPTNPATYTDWGYAFATTLSTNGDSHLDFEIFRNEVTLDSAGQLQNTGSDGGHTAYTFFPDGSINVPGDFILVGDYVNGGAQVDVHMRAWVNPSALPGATSGGVAARFAAFDTLSNRPFNFSTNAADFDAGPAPWYYATITPKNPAQPFAFTRVNAHTDPCQTMSENTLGAPWGNEWNSGPDCGDSIQARQFVEGAINFGLVGQAVPINSGTCRNIFGTLMVKTRSSASFTAELKDLVGPIPFGSFTPVALQTSNDTLDCDSSSAYLCASSQSVGPVVICFEGPAATAAGPFAPISCSAPATPNNYCISVTQGGYYHVVSTLNGGCFSDTVIQVVDNTDNTPPTITCPGNSTIDCPATPSWVLPTASDNKDQNVDVQQLGSEVCSGTCPMVCTRTYIATDDCGNTATCSYSITVRDVTPPTITCPTVSSPIDCPAVPSFGNATANDACDASVAISFVDVTTPNCTGIPSVTRTWTATDDCGNTATCSRTITVRDITPPTITCPTVSSPIDCPAVPSFGQATANDACDASVAISFVDVTTPNCTGIPSVTRTWTATDDCGNTATCSRTIVVRDITPPTITCPTVSSPIDCPAVPSFGPATANDACDASVAISFVDVTTPNCTGIPSVTRTWTATDDCGNTATCSRTIIVRDITPPTITCPTVSSPIDCPAVPSFGPATANDACDASVAISFVDVTTPNCTGIPSVTRTWTATDDCGNTATCSRTIVVRDITPPTITCPTVSSPIDCPAVPSFGPATANDACDASVAISFVDVTTPNCTGIPSVTRTWTATDDCGNTATCSRTIIVRDITPPTITCPTVSSPIDCPAVPSFGPATANDACDASVAISFVDVTTPNCTGIPSVTRTWTATDDCGNTATCSRTIVVRDITPPTITCPTVSSPIDCPAVPSFGPATANDACDASVAISFVDVTTPNCTGIPNVTRTWTATDDCGNTATCSRTITVRDITPPTITCPTVSSPIDCPAVPSFGQATANDACDASVAISFVDVTTPNCTGIPSVTRTWTATDDCGNTATCSRTIIVRDITPPTITCPTVSSPIDCPAVPSFGPATANDACDASVAISFVDVTTPNCTGIPSVTRTWTATDDCGNTATCSRTIVVRDITPPTITCPTVQTPLNCPASPSFGNATANDACDASVAISFVDVTTPGCTGGVTRTWTATDDCGNTATCSRTIVIHDVTPPTITCPTVSSPIDCPAVPSFGPATANDACDASVDITFQDVTTPNCTGIPSVTRTWTATDDCGNTATCSRTIIVRDITPPTITCPTVSSPIDCPAVPSFGQATANDACDASVAISFVDVTTPNCTGIPSVTRTWTATDDCGNTATCSRTIIVRDITPPTITCPTVSSPIDCPAVPSFGPATANDACDASVAISFVDVTTPNCTGIPSVTRTWTATDDCGNTATCSRTIIVRDITPPTITCPTVSSPIDCPAVPSFGPATANDACDASVAISFVDVTTPNCTGIPSVTRTWTATDDCGNTATCSRTIIVRDITPPTITCPTVSSPINCPAVPSFGPATANDACDASVAISFVDVTTPNCTGIPSVTRTWTATDDCGNTATCSRTIIVRDITPPTITCPTVSSPIDCPAVPSFGPATANDACDASVAISFVDVTTPNCTGIPSVTRTWTATDDCGNTSTCSRTIIVRDITPPTITCPTVSSPIDCPAVPSFGPATANDACDASVAISFVDVTTPNCTGIPSVTRTWTATDDCGNTSTCSRTIVVRDITPPTITCPTVSSPINCPATPSFGPATANDACDASVAISFADVTTNVGCGSYSVTRTWRATDDCGNTSTCSRTVVVQPIAISCTLTAPTPRPFCGSTGNTLCVSAVNAVSYKWTLVSGQLWAITSADNIPCITYTAGSSDSVTFSVEVTNACGCKSTCTVTFGCQNPYWGCTLGFWKNHTAIWDQTTDPISMCVTAGITSLGSPYSGSGISSALFRQVFGIDSAHMVAAGYAYNMTLLQALNLGGGTWGLLARSGVAALLNSCGLSGHYYYMNPTQVITIVHNTVMAGSATGANTAGNDFQKHNETKPDNCPPGGPANPKASRELMHTAYGNAFGDEIISINAYPNPFESTATIEFVLNSTTPVSVAVFDLNGKQVADLYTGTAEANQSYQLHLDGTNLPAGIYVYRITAGDAVYNDRLILIK